MDKIVLDGVSEILNNHHDLLKIVLRQKSKFEGWLKFELASLLAKKGMEGVEVETKLDFRKDRFDISFFYNEEFYLVELKTVNTNWKIDGVNHSGRPITKNIDAVIHDTKKLNSINGIIAFVMFPIPVNDKRWEVYIDRISNETEIEIHKQVNCKTYTFQINETNRADMVICSYRSRKFSNLW